LLHAVYSSLADARCDIKQLLTLSGADHPSPMSQGATQRCRGHARILAVRQLGAGSQRTRSRRLVASPRTAVASDDANVRV